MESLQQASLQHFLEVAVSAAEKAGELIRSRLGDYRTLETKSSLVDLVTDVDRASEALISQMILDRFPTHRFLGEEGTTGGPARHEHGADPAGVEFLWVCDPIDGTTNFVHGLPCCTVALCLAHWGEPVVGVVYEPARGEMFTAVKGSGAMLNGRPMRVRPERTLGESLLGTGFATQPRVRERNVQGLVAVAPLCRNLRNLGSAQLHLAYVAAGRLTGFWEAGLSPWDMAAGYVLVTEAGGRVTDLDGSPYSLGTHDVIATNGPIHDDLRALVDIR